MRRMHKYPIGFRTQLALPHGSIVRHVAIQNEKPMLWVEVDSDGGYSPEIREFHVLATGEWQDDNRDYDYIGTFIDTLGLVWHLYEVKRK